MPITPWRGLWEVRFPSLQDEMDKLFEDFFGRTGFPAVAQGTWIPAVDVAETKKEVIVTVDLPAMDPKEVNISVVDDKLVIKGERRKEEEATGQDYYRTERAFGAFQRTIQLPSEVVGGKAKAAYKDGVLMIRIPKSEKSMPKEIKVEIQ